MLGKKRRKKARPWQATLSGLLGADTGVLSSPNTRQDTLSVPSISLSHPAWQLLPDLKEKPDMRLLHLTASLNSLEFPEWFTPDKLQPPRNVHATEQRVKKHCPLLGETFSRGKLHSIIWNRPSHEPHKWYHSKVLHEPVKTWNL